MSVLLFSPLISLLFNFSELGWTPKNVQDEKSINLYENRFHLVQVLLEDQIPLLCC